MIAPQTLLQNRYLVTEQIGQGGMGAVYVATDQRFGSVVALKETFFTDPSLRKAFEREARLLNRLRHTALPRVSDHFVEDEGQFLVMEYIAGEDLWDMLKTQGGAFPLKEVLGWADQLLDALDYLHTQEPPVIHRDIKPQNLKLTPRGQIILLDFGLAKGTPLQVSQVSAAASVFGYSRNYAPIEQIQGTGTDTRSDLYSLAATLYHLMTGATPPDALTRAAAVLNGQADPLRPANEAHTQVTPAVAQVLMRAMSQNAGHRPQTAAAMRDALREAGKQTFIAGNVTNVQSSTSSAVLEQDTQLKDAAHAAPTVADAVERKMDSVLAYQEATVDDAAHATSASGTPMVTGGNEQAESVVTQVKPLQPRLQQTPPVTRKRFMSGRTLGIAASALMLVLVAAVVYALTRHTAQPAADTQTAPTQTNAPPANNPQAEQTNVNQATENRNASTPAAPQTSTTPTTPRLAAPDKTVKRAAETSASKDKVNVPQPPAPPTGELPDDYDPMANGGKRGRRKDNPYYNPEQVDEQRRQAMQMKEQAREEKRLALEERRRIQQMRRRERMRQP
jgi:serine/threonine protein kinase